MSWPLDRVRVLMLAVDRAHGPGAALREGVACVGLLTSAALIALLFAIITGDAS